MTLFVQGAQSWKHEHEWPVARTEVRTLYATGGNVLAGENGPSGADRHETDPTVGPGAGLWDPLGTGVGYPVEQAAGRLPLTDLHERAADGRYRDHRCAGGRPACRARGRQRPAADGEAGGGRGPTAAPRCSRPAG